MARLAPPAGRHGVFLRSEATVLGWTPDAVRAAIAAGRVKRIRPGAYWVAGPLPDDRFEARREWHRVQAVAAALVNPVAMISHTSASIMRNVPVLKVPDQPCLTVPGRYVGDVAGVHLHQAAMPATHQTRVDELRLSTVARSVVDIGREHGPQAALVSADAALRDHFCTARDLVTVIRDCHGWPGVRGARLAVDLADARSESPLESSSRFLLRDLVPVPELQVDIFDHNGVFLGRADLFWREFGVVGEIDGMSKYTAPSVLRKEKTRQEAFERTGLILVRWGAEDLKRCDVVAARLLSAFSRSAAPGRLKMWRTQAAS